MPFPRRRNRTIGDSHILKIFLIIYVMWKKDQNKIWFLNVHEKIWKMQFFSFGWNFLLLFWTYLLLFFHSVIMDKHDTNEIEKGNSCNWSKKQNTKKFHFGTSKFWSFNVWTILPPVRRLFLIRSIISFTTVAYMEIKCENLTTLQSWWGRGKKGILNSFVALCCLWVQL